MAAFAVEQATAFAVNWATAFVLNELPNLLLKCLLWSALLLLGWLKEHVA